MAQSSSVIVQTGPGRDLAFWLKTVVSDCPMLFAGLMFGPLCCCAEPRGQGVVTFTYILWLFVSVSGSGSESVSVVGLWFLFGALFHSSAGRYVSVI